MRCGCAAVEIGRLETGARYGVGSLVNSLLPGHFGGAVRIALFSRALPGRKRLWVAGGIPAAVGILRTALLGLLVVAEIAGGLLPAWMAIPVSGAGCAFIVTCLWARRTRPSDSGPSQLLEVFRSLGRSPRATACLLGWLFCSLGAQLAAVGAVTEALDVRAPVAAAFIIVPALAATSFVALLPAGIGVTSGAVAIILHQRGVDTTTALAVGVALDAVETAVGLIVGIASASLLAFPSSSARRWTLVTVGAGLCVIVASSFGAGSLGEFT